MLEPKMGGMERLSIFLKGNADLVNSLLAKDKGGAHLDQGLAERIHTKYGGTVEVEITHELYGRSDLLLQQLVGQTVPDELLEQSLLDDQQLTAQFNSKLFASRPDVVIFSIQPDVTHRLWTHRAEGYSLYVPEDVEQGWSEAQRAWFQTHFHNGTLLDVGKYQENALRLIQAIKDKLQAHVIILNASSVDPEDWVHNYHRMADTFALRINRFNLLLMKLSVEEGISIIDVDRLIAERGGQEHVCKLFNYSGLASAIICEETERVLTDIGFFEKRSLVMQVGGIR